MLIEYSVMFEYSPQVVENKTNSKGLSEARQLEWPELPHFSSCFYEPNLNM